MTMSFADQVKEAVATAQDAPGTEPAKRYRAVLDELASGLTELGVGALIHPGRDPRKLTLRLYPQHRPARVNAMLSFFLDGDAIVVSGETSTQLKSPEALQRWLLDFVKLPELVESIRVLREQAELPVEARLRVDAKMAYMKGDVMVLVSKDDQKKLDEADIGAEVDIDVERIEFPGNAQLGEVAPYAVLESAGLLLEVQKTTPDGAKLKIHGRRRAALA
jgi:hypothetical protein